MTHPTETAVEALRELVACKDLEELARMTSAERIEYEWRLQLAWEAARRVLASTEPAPEPCIGNDPLCPCQDGYLCHYRGKDAWPVPAAAPAGEPVAWSVWIPGESLYRLLFSSKRACEESIASYRDAYKDAKPTPLYAAPPVETLTDEQIDEIAGEEGVYPGFGDAVLCDVRMIRTFARAILSTAFHTQEKP